MKLKHFYEKFRDNPGCRIWVASLVVLCRTLLPVPFTAFGADGYGVEGRIVTGIAREPLAAAPRVDQTPIMEQTQITLFALPTGKIIAKTSPGGNGEFAFSNLVPFQREPESEPGRRLSESIPDFA